MSQSDSRSKCVTECVSKSFTECLSTCLPERLTNQIAQRFAKAQHSYAQAAAVQQHMVAALLQQLAVAMPPSTQGTNTLQRVLEIGCGSGLFTQAVVAQYAINNLFLNDLYQAALLPLHPVQPHSAMQIDWLIGDIEQLELPQQLDVIMSNAAVQWLHDLPQLWARCFAALNAQGLLVFSSFADGNLSEIKQLTGQGLRYLSLDALQQQLQHAGFEVVCAHEEQIRLCFNSPRAVLQHLRATGVTATNANFRWSKSRLQQFELDYAQFAQPNEQDVLQYPLTYTPIYVVARKPQ